MRTGWEIKTLGEVCDISAGQGAPQGEDNYCLDGTPFIKAGNLEALVNGEGEQSVQKVSKEVALSHRLVLQKKGSIVFAKSGMSCMKGYVYTLQQDCYVVSHLAVLFPKSVSGQYLNYALHFFKPSSLAKDASFPSITLKDLAIFPIPFPTSLQEQQRIVDVLDQEFAKIDALKANAEKSLQAAKDLFQATLKKELEPKEGWTQQELGTIADFKNGLNFGKEVGNFRFRFLGVGDFKDNLCVDVNTLGQIQKDEIDDDYLLHENDIVFVRSNGSKQLVGRCLLVKNAKEKATFSGFCIRCRLKGEALLPQYLIHFCTMDETKKYLTSSGEGCNISNLNQRVLSSLKVWAPKSREEQARIVAIIEQQRDNINDLQDNYQKTLTLCDDLKQSLLRKAFTGEL